MRKDLVSKYANMLTVGDWVFVETFSLNYASEGFCLTSHLYKMSFVIGTSVIPSPPKSDSNYLTLATFQKIQSGELNPTMLVSKLSFYNNNNSIMYEVMTDNNNLCFFM